MSSDSGSAGVRIVEGPEALKRLGEEAAALGARALVVSPAQPDPREAGLLQEAARSIRNARVGHHPFPRVPRPGSPIDACLRMAAEGARESRCRLIIGIGDWEALEVARTAARETLLPCLVIPTAVGFGPLTPADPCPLPDVLIADPRALAGSPPRRTAALGVLLLCGLVERFAGQDSSGAARRIPEEAEPLFEEAMRRLVDSLPAAVRSPQDPGPREGLAAATARAAEAMAAAGSGPTPLERLAARVARSGSDAAAVRAALLPAAMDASGPAPAALALERVARFGRNVLAIREADDGRAASWASGGIGQWVRDLGFEPKLPGPRPGAGGGGDEALRALLSRAVR